MGSVSGWVSLSRGDLEGRKQLRKRGENKQSVGGCRCCEEQGPRCLLSSAPCGQSGGGGRSPCQDSTHCRPWTRRAAFRGWQSGLSPGWLGGQRCCRPVEPILWLSTRFSLTFGRAQPTPRSTLRREDKVMTSLGGRGDRNPKTFLQGLPRRTLLPLLEADTC